MDGMVGLPWCPVPSSPDEANILPAVVHAEPLVAIGELPPPIVPVAVGLRRVYIRRGVELLKYGYTVGCLGCDAARSDTVAKPHSDACRKRVEQAMAADEAGAARVAQAAERRAARDEVAGEEAPPAKRRAQDDVPMQPVPAMPGAIGGAASSSSAAAASLSLRSIARELCALGTRVTAHDLTFDEQHPQLDLHPSLLLDLRIETNLARELVRDRAEKTMKKMKPALVLGCTLAQDGA